MANRTGLQFLKTGRRHIKHVGNGLVKTECVTNLQTQQLDRQLSSSVNPFGSSPLTESTERQYSSSSLPHLPEMAGTDERLDDVTKIFKRNREWAATLQPDFFAKTGRQHSPDYFWIGCADARLAANQILGLEPGEVFVHRNVANLVVNTDLNLLSALQYAVQFLKVKHIFVCGHYDCGGVRAAATNQHYGDGILDAWIRNIRDVIRLHSSYLDSVSDPEEYHKRLVEFNTIEQAINLFKTGIVQKSRIDSAQDPSSDLAYPRIHACVYDPADGILRGLPTNWKTYLHKYRHIYDLYESDKFQSVYEPDKYEDPKE